jgi:hypothetical protein
MYDPVVKPEVLAAVLAVSVCTVTRDTARGKVPPPDITPHRRCVAWRLSTIKCWNPYIAGKIERGIRSEIFSCPSVA